MNNVSFQFSVKSHYLIGKSVASWKLGRKLRQCLCQGCWIGPAVVRMARSCVTSLGWARSVEVIVFGLRLSQHRTSCFGMFYSNAVNKVGVYLCSLLLCCTSLFHSSELSIPRQVRTYIGYSSTSACTTCRTSPYNNTSAIPAARSP